MTSESGDGDTTKAWRTFVDQKHGKATWWFEYAPVFMVIATIAVPVSGGVAVAFILGLWPIPVALLGYLVAGIVFDAVHAAWKRRRT